MARTSAEFACRRLRRSYGGRVRRPSAAMLVALLALFVALGGPAQAKHLIDGKDIRNGTVTSKQIKDRSITTRDLSTGTVRRAADAPPTARSRAGKLVPGAVGGLAIADGTVAAAGHRRRRGRLRQARRRLRDRRQDRRRDADDRGHRALQRRVPDPRRGPRDDQGARVLEPRAARPRPRGRRRRHLPGRAARRTRARPSTGRSSASTTAPTRERLGRGQPLRPDALQPHRQLDATPPSIAFSYIVFDLP